MDRLRATDALQAKVPRLAMVDFVLLGEVHDNPVQHGARHDWLARQVASGSRFAVAMEQFDRPQQAAVDDARKNGRPARELAEAAKFDFRGWQWEFYRPVIELALRNDLPLIATNLAPADTLAISRGGSHPLAGIVPSGWGDAERLAQADDIRSGHCNLLPERMIEPMASAQRARDAQMAQALVEARRATGLPVVLLAGNGHTRSDLGVARYLRDLMPGARIVSVGLLEEERERGPAAGSRYDVVVVTPRQPRPDPCGDLRRRFG